MNENGNDFITQLDGIIDSSFNYLTHIVVLWIPRPQKIANASNIDISQFVNWTPFAWTYTRTPMTFFWPVLIGMHKIHFDSWVMSSLKLLMLYSLWLFNHSDVSLMFKISPVLATYWAIWAKTELLISSIDGRPFDFGSSLPYRNACQRNMIIML